MVFTEQGIAMLSGVLNSKRAIHTNIQIMRAFIQLREMAMTFQKGHRMVLEIRAQDSSVEEPIWYHQTNAVPTRHTIHCGGKGGSYLLLPRI